ncbi:MAG TPA: hypothetical protein VJB16_02685 [archaeon]|nr:hypothetical protein [archaeon]
MKKLRIGWFSFSCCEDSTIVFTELLNDHFEEWKDKVEFCHVRVLKKRNALEGLDVAFVEGAICTPKAEAEVKRIRASAKRVIAIGACADTGMPSGQRNRFDLERQAEIEPIVRAFDYSKTVRSLKEVIPVDGTVPGCPMAGEAFVAMLEKLLKEFGA